MAWRALKIEVATQATKLGSDDWYRHSSGLIRNEGPRTVYVGPDTVTVEDGFPLPMGGVISTSIVGQQHLYGVVQSGSADVRILRISDE